MRYPSSCKRPTKFRLPPDPLQVEAGTALSHNDPNKRLEDNPLLGPLGEEVHQALLADAHELHVPAGSTIFRQGEEARFLRVVLEGRIALMANSEENTETVVEFFNAGDLFILPAVILELPYLMSARAVEDSRVLMIPDRTFRHALTQHHALSLAINHELARHWRLLIRQIKDLKLRSAPQRLAAYLLSLAPHDAQQAAAIHLPEKRQMLARRLAMTPENLSRAFRQLRDLGVTGRGQEIELTDIDGLRAFCAYDDLF